MFSVKGEEEDQLWESDVAAGVSLRTLTKAGISGEGRSSKAVDAANIGDGVRLVLRQRRLMVFC